VRAAGWIAVDTGPWLPLWLLIVMLIVVPVCVGLFFGAFSFKGLTPNAFHCGRCDRDFQRKAWRRFPKTCKHCGARDWNTPRT